MAYTFAPFAPFEPYVWPYLRQICRFRGIGGGVPPKGRRREAQLRSHRILKFPKKIFSKKSLAAYPMPFEIFFLENSSLSQCKNLFSLVRSVYAYPQDLIEA